jgi:triosephosphate isomerase (TIM)
LREKIIAGNWKMYKTIPEAAELAGKLNTSLAGITDREAVICPPFTVLSSVKKVMRTAKLSLGAQDMFWEEKGAYTGEISPWMLVDAGCKYVIIGHSERRQYFHETDETVNKKMLAAYKCGLVPIVCVGETLAEREQNMAFQVIERQIKEGLKGLSAEQSEALVIAYEPVWAIGTGKTATPAQAQEIHAYIRKLYSVLYGKNSGDKVRILYGGSVKPDNCAELMGQPDIDGGLVGGAALDADSFTRIVKYDGK